MIQTQEFRISWEWEAAPGVRIPEHQATWARIEIWVGSDCVTLVEDRESGSSRRSVYCPLYPLAEWVAYNWWFLQADTRPSRALSQYGRITSLTSELREHHSVRSSGDGFVWPDLVIVPDGDRTHLLWQDDWPGQPDWPIRFLSRGDRWVSSAEVQRELSEMVSSVLTRLAEQGIGVTALQKEWEAIGSADPEEVSFSLAAARLGLDPYSDAERYGNAIINAARTLSDDLLTDFLDAVNPERIEPALAWVSSARSRILQPSPALIEDGEAFQRLREEARGVGPLAHTLPWQLGWGYARIVRESQEADVSRPFEIERYIGSNVELSDDPDLQAIGGRTKRRPLAVLGQRRPATTMRFTLSRALWHCIWDDAPVFAVTAAHTYRQAVERAFAAELLAPASGIASMLQSPPEVASDEELEQVAEHFGVASMVIGHQVRNQLVPDF
jgi:hypothetical protein